MSPRRLLAFVISAAATLSAISTSVLAQRAEPAGHERPAAECSYESCALGITPRWNGLAVARGAAGVEVANLNFFWPRDISSALRTSAASDGADPAYREARLAVSLRRIGAVLTDGGLVLAAVGAVGALHAGHIRRVDGAFIAAGGAALGVSIPLQFAADGALSRAVWFHNARFAR